MRPLTSEEQALAVEHLKVAEIAACRMYQRFHDRLSLEEMISSATYGLCKAAQGFRTGKGAKFATYATRTCMQQIRDDVMALGYLIHLPRHTFSKSHRSKVYKSKTHALKALEMHASADRAQHIERWSRAQFDTLSG